MIPAQASQDKFGMTAWRDRDRHSARRSAIRPLTNHTMAHPSPSPSTRPATDLDVAPTSSDAQAKLLARVDQLRLTLATTTLSVSELIALNRSFDAADAVAYHTEQTQPHENGDGGEPDASGAQETSKSRPGSAGAGADDLTARVARLAAELQRRADESRYIQRRACHRAAAAAETIAALEGEAARRAAEAERSTHAHATSLSELRLLATRMQRLERRVDGLTAWPASAAASATASPATPGPGSQRVRPVTADGSLASWAGTAGTGEEAVARWWRGAQDWWADWGEVGRRVERRRDGLGLKDARASRAENDQKSRRAEEVADDEEEWVNVRGAS